MMKIIEIGGYATLQDPGRSGLRKYGVPVSGYVDTFSAQLANQVAGNRTAEPLIELFGGVLKFQSSASRGYVITGGTASISIDQKKLKSPCQFTTKPGSEINIGPITEGNIIYIAVTGGFHANKSFGSASTYVPAGLGGNNGKPLRNGDTIGYNTQHGNHLNYQVLSVSKYYPTLLNVKVQRGPEYEMLMTEAQSILQTESFTVENTSRMGYRLKGTKLATTCPRLTSRFVTRGTVQLPLGGDPIVLLSDAQTTGGYPRILQVSDDMIDDFAQLKKGNRVRFTIT